MLGVLWRLNRPSLSCEQPPQHCPELHRANMLASPLRFRNSLFVTGPCEDVLGGRTRRTTISCHLPLGLCRLRYQCSYFPSSPNSWLQTLTPIISVSGQCAICCGPGSMGNDPCAHIVQLQQLRACKNTPSAGHGGKQLVVSEFVREVQRKYVDLAQ